MEDRISVSMTDGVADVRLVRADKMNALDAEMFEARFPVVYNTVFDESIFEHWCGDDRSPLPAGERPLRSAEEIRQTFAAHGITHVYVNWLEVLRYRSPGNYGYTDFASPRAHFP